MKNPVSLVTMAVFLALGMVLPLAPTAVAQQAENKVRPDFSTHWIYDSPENIFTNGEVTGRKDWHANIGRGVSLPGLTLTLDSTLNFDHIIEENLTTTGPPTYVWFLSDVPPGTYLGAYVGFGSLDSPGVVPVTFTPGFDASRSADKTEFSAPGIQTLTITLTPREATEQFNIVINADENDLVNPVIISPTSGDGIELKKEGHSLHIDPTGLEPNTTWTITITIQVTPKVPEVEYMPFVGIGSREPLDSGNASGNSFSLPVADMGTWTCSAEGSYEWDWTDALIRQVCWHHFSGGEGGGSTQAVPLKGNHVFVGFVDELSHPINAWEDSFTNAEVIGVRRWRVSHTENIKDETGEPVRGLKITLDSDLVFDSVGGWGVLTTKSGPPTYEWFYGDLSEDYTGHPKDANVMLRAYGNLTTFRPGFDVSRSFDKTVFTTPDTQTVTVTFTKREETFERVLITVGTQNANTDLVDAVITSRTAECDSEIDPSGRYIEFGGMDTGGVPVELNTPLTVTVTIQVTPKVPIVEYKPQVHVAPYYLGRRYDSGIVEGSSFSFTDEAGTWTVSAEGDYIWNWDASLDPRFSIDMMEERGNTPPALISAGVPTSGTPKTDFEVTYVDDGPPSYVHVYIDGSAHDMCYVACKAQGYADGAIFSHTTALSPGQHTYYFEASDVSGLTTRFPEDGTLSLEVTSQRFPVWIVAGIAIIIGSVMFFFIRRRIKKAIS